MLGQIQIYGFFPSISPIDDLANGIPTIFPIFFPNEEVWWPKIHLAQTGEDFFEKREGLLAVERRGSD